jgi:transcriptional regulator with XRE-family HTH domain
MANTPKAFSSWFSQWLDDNPDWTGERLSAELKVSEAAISAWRNGTNSPRAEYILRLSEITGLSHHKLANLAYGWPEDPPTDPLMAEPLYLELMAILRQLWERGRDLFPGLIETARGLLRLARKRNEPARGKGNGN